jgi:alpha-ketoglutarate-dependent taurine dioxygenase
MTLTQQMTPILRHRILSRDAWVGSDFKSKDDIAFDLTSKQVAALEDLLLRLKDVPRDQIVLAQCVHPSLDEYAKQIFEELLEGRGLVLLRGFPVKDHSIEEIEKLYWIFTRHFGPHLPMNSFGHKMVRVQDESLPDGRNSARGTKGRDELAMHTDTGDIFALLYVRQAEKGGESQFSSASAAHNRILAERPDLLPILYRGFPHHRRGEQAPHQAIVTPYNVPVFANNSGRVALKWTYSSIAPALAALGRQPTDEEQEALDMIGRVLHEQQLEIRAESGDMSIANNYAMAHSRSAFVDGSAPEKRRLVLRAWMELPPWRKRLPVHLGREFHHLETEAGRLASEPIPGRDALARNEYVNVPESVSELIRQTQKKPRAETAR